MMKELKDVLMVSKPVSPPWQDSNKNLTRNIINYVNNVRFHILTPKGYHFSKDNVVSEDIYQSTGDYAPAIQQNLQALFYLITLNKEIDLFHFFYTPNPRTSLILKHLTKFKNVPSFQTVLSSPKDYTNIKDLLFADKIIVLSDYNKRKIEEAGVANVVKISPGLDLREIDNKQTDYPDFKKKYNLEDKKLILFAGDYEFSGANKVILECIPPIVSKIPDVKFLFACRKKTEESQPIENDLKQYAIDLGMDKYIQFLGTVTDMYDLIQSIDICLFPVKSLYAKMDIPLVLLECMAYSKPVIISDIAPINEIMLDDIGYSVDVGSIDQIVKALTEMLEFPEIKNQKGYNARKVVENYFNMDKLYKNYEKLYEEILYG